MSTITELLEQQKDNTKKLSKAKKNSELLNKQLMKQYLKMHQQLTECGFYTNMMLLFCMNDRHKPLTESFTITGYSLPYSYCGEGDYKCIHFKAHSGMLRLNFSCSFERSYNYTIAKIPLELFNIDRKVELQDFINNLVEENKGVINRYLKQQKENKRKELEKQFQIKPSICCRTQTNEKRSCYTSTKST
jgi:hypothetical protein